MREAMNLFWRRQRRIEAALKYAYSRGFAVGQTWKGHPLKSVANAEYQWETAGRHYCMEAYRNPPKEQEQ